MWTWEKKQSIIRQDPASVVREKQVAVLAEAGLETRDREIAQHSRLLGKSRVGALTLTAVYLALPGAKCFISQFARFKWE